MKRVRDLAYRVASPPFLSNFYDVFHVFQLWKCIVDFSHMIQVDDEQVKENLTIEASSSRVEDREVEHLKGKKIALVMAVLGGPVGRSMTWEPESRMKELYSTLSFR